MHRDLEYEKNNIGYDYQYPEGGIKCKNYELCNTVLPDWWYECKGHYICTNCDILFGTWGHGENTHYGKGELIFSNNLECPICLQNKRCVSQPRCEHFACLNCFKRCYFLDQSDDGAPEFPYDSEIEEEYNENPDDPKWDINYPLIEEYNEMWNAWDDAKREKYDNENYLRVCPLCRK
jgi:hypothetical protein